MQNLPQTLPARSGLAAVYALSYLIERSYVAPLLLVVRMLLAVMPFVTSSDALCCLLLVAMPEAPLEKSQPLRLGTDSDLLRGIQADPPQRGATAPLRDAVPCPLRCQGVPLPCIGQGGALQSGRPMRRRKRAIPRPPGPSENFMLSIYFLQLQL